MESRPLSPLLLDDLAEGAGEPCERSGRGARWPRAGGGRRADADHDVHHVRRSEIGAKERTGRVERWVRIVRREVGVGIASRFLNRAPRFLVDNSSGRVRGPIASIGAAGKECRSACALRERELPRCCERELLAPSAGTRCIPHRHRRLTPPKEAALHWSIGQWRWPRATIAY